MGTTTRRRINAVTDEAIAERKTQILQHAADVIVTAGVTGFSFAAVAESSGFSIGMIQHYFRTRDRLLDACIDRRIVESEAEWREIYERGSTPIERLSALLEYAVVGEKDFADAWGFWLELNAAARLDASLREKVNERLTFWHQMFHNTLAETIAAGYATPTRPIDDLSYALLALTDGLAMQAINATYGMTARRMHELLYGFVASELRVDLGLLQTPAERYH